MTRRIGFAGNSSASPRAIGAANRAPASAAIAIDFKLIAARWWLPKTIPPSTRHGDPAFMSRRHSQPWLATTHYVIASRRRSNPEGDLDCFVAARLTRNYARSSWRNRFHPTTVMAGPRAGHPRRDSYGRVAVDGSVERLASRSGSTWMAGTGAGHGGLFYDHRPASISAGPPPRAPRPPP